MNVETVPRPQKAGRSRAFILRLWSENSGGLDARRTWRVSLQDASTGARRGFSSLEEFFDYLVTHCSDDETD